MLEEKGKMSYYGNSVISITPISPGVHNLCPGSWCGIIDFLKHRNSVTNCFFLLKSLNLPHLVKLLEGEGVVFFFCVKGEKSAISVCILGAVCKTRHLNSC